MKTIVLTPALFILLMLGAWEQSVQAQTSTAPSAGDGTSGNPYQIATLNNLYWISQNSSEWDNYYIQTADIDASTSSGWDGGSGFTRIGNTGTQFTGQYDGDGHIISGLTINRAINYVGLFGYISGATVKDLGMENVNIIAQNEVAGLAGNAINSSISGCYSTGNITGSGNFCGGIIGNCEGTTVTDSYNRASVTGNALIGGFVGHAITGSTIISCYSTGTVTGNSDVGGFVGYANASTTTNNFWDTQTSGKATSFGATGKTTAEMKTLATFTGAGWDFEIEAANGTNNIWDMDAANGVINNGYPFLSWQNGPSVALPVELTSFTGFAKNNSVELHWKTATEVNNYGFEVQKSEVGGQKSEVSWKRIGFVEGSGTTNSPKSYSFIDAAVQGKVVYRLKQIDNDGQFQYSSEVEVMIAQTPNAFTLEQNYPNPFNPATEIRYQISEVSRVALKVYDAIGGEVATLVNEVKEAGSYSVTFNASNLASGMYFARLQSGGEQMMKKLLLIK